LHKLVSNFVLCCMKWCWVTVKCPRTMCKYSYYLRCLIYSNSFENMKFHSQKVLQLFIYGFSIVSVWKNWFYAHVFNSTTPKTYLAKSISSIISHCWQWAKKAEPSNGYVLMTIWVRLGAFSSNFQQNIGCQEKCLYWNALLHFDISILKVVKCGLGNWAG